MKRSATKRRPEILSQIGGDVLEDHGYRFVLEPLVEVEHDETPQSNQIFPVDFVQQIAWHDSLRQRQTQIRSRTDGHLEAEQNHQDERQQAEAVHLLIFRSRSGRLTESIWPPGQLRSALNKRTVGLLAFGCSQLRRFGGSQAIREARTVQRWRIL